VIVLDGVKERVRPRKTIEEERSLHIHVSFPNPCSESRKQGQSSSGPVQTPSMSSIKRPRRARFLHGGEDFSFLLVAILGCCVYAGAWSAHGRANVLPPESVINLEDI
jgi:hypothetical protein